MVKNLHVQPRFTCLKIDIFLTSQENMLLVLIRSALVRHFLRVPTKYVFLKNKKKYISHNLLLS